MRVMADVIGGAVPAMLFGGQLSGRCCWREVEAKELEANCNNLRKELDAPRRQIGDGAGAPALPYSKLQGLLHHRSQ